MIRIELDRATYAGTSGDVSVTVRIKRNGDGSASEIAVMEYSIARYVNP